MTQEVINTGTLPNDGRGDTLRVAARKINNNFTQLFSTPLVEDATARQRANAAFDAANTKIAKTGDIVSGELIFRTDAEANYPNTKIGNIQDANGIDLFAGSITDFAQLNWANTNLCYVDAYGVRNVTPNTTFELQDAQERVVVTANTIAFTFNSNGRISIFDSSVASDSILAPGFRNVVKVTSSAYNTSNTNDVIFCDPNAAGANITVNFSANVAPGKTYTVKNINSGGFNARVNGTERAYPYIEDPVTHSFVTSYTIPTTGAVYTWVFESGVYRYIG